MLTRRRPPFRILKIRAGTLSYTIGHFLSNALDRPPLDSDDVLLRYAPSDMMPPSLSPVPLPFPLQLRQL
jgi:hypothetical protein